MPEMSGVQDGTEHPHRIEQCLNVYLTFDGEKWGIDHTTVDGRALDGLPGGAEGCECNCDRGNPRQALEHAQWIERAGDAHLPNAEQLLRGLADALGYDLNARARR